MGIVLTPHQEEKLNELKSLLKAGHKRIVIKGSAGCGKTVLASKIIEVVRKDYSLTPHYNNGSIYVTAPTNKALAVLQDKIQFPVEFKTIHSALRMSMYTDSKTGIRRFVKQNSYKDDTFPKCRICIIDECSMLNTEFVGGEVENPDGNTEYVTGYLEEYQFPIIFIGDNKQLNPVGEENSPVFHKGWPEVELTEIVRQGEGNPIIELSRDIDMIFFKRPKLIENKGYIYSNSKADIIEQLAEVNGTDELKYLSYTNTDVDEMNKLVRERIYGEKPKRIEKGETLVFNTPHEGFYTNKEVKVDDIEIIADFMPVPTYKTKFDRNGEPIGNLEKIKMRYYRVNNAFNIVHEQSDNIFKAISQSLNQNCKKFNWNWKSYYYFIEMFADIKYNHAITVHKSQGSTYKTSIVNVGNLNLNPKAGEKKRLFYTAVTRSSHLLILNNVR